MSKRRGKEQNQEPAENKAGIYRDDIHVLIGELRTKNGMIVNQSKDIQYLNWVLERVNEFIDKNGLKPEDLKVFVREAEDKARKEYEAAEAAKSCGPKILGVDGKPVN